jgi:hypothetical protein
VRSCHRAGGSCTGKRVHPRPDGVGVGGRVFHISSHGLKLVQPATCQPSKPALVKRAAPQPRLAPPNPLLSPVTFRR